MVGANQLTKVMGGSAMRGPMPQSPLAALEATTRLLEVIPIAGLSPGMQADIRDRLDRNHRTIDAKAKRREARRLTR